MNGLPWDTIRGIIREIGGILIIIWAIRFAMFLIGTLCVKFCPHCSRKV